jgi:eukaryotic-like serine/threonine-protein kinase
LLTATYKICSSCGARTSSDVRHCPACGRDLADVDALAGDPYVGLALAEKYLIESLIGEGAMGRVYRAKQIPLGKPFAVKILAPHLMNDEASHARFANEAHNCASLNHPNCISVVDYGRSPEGITYIVMEFIAGQTLEEIIARDHPLPPERVTDLLLQVLAALTEAHGLGILHRDLKPENILVQQLRTHGELAKVLDFGIAKLMDSTAGGPGLTSHGMVCGTPEYMSPEQARGQKLDARSDLYAVGVILYQMLTGRPPFESDSAVEILHKHLHEEPIAPSQLLGTQGHPLEAVCMRAMAKDPDERHTSAQEFREEVIATTSAAPAASIECRECSARIRADHRFCPSCGAAAPAMAPDTPPPTATRRRSSPGSGLNTPRQLGEPTAEVVVRKFPLPLVGRDQELARFETLLTLPEPSGETATGVAVRVISGPRGVGKTRLGDEIATLAEHKGWTAYWVGADPSGARTPLWPIQCMAAQLLQLDAGRVNTQDLGRLANLLGLSFEGLPGLAELFELHGPAHDLEFRVRRRECFASAVQALLGGGRGRPLLLVFDDLEAFDAPSREVVRRLAQGVARSPVALVCLTSEQDVAWLSGNVERLEPLGPEVVERIGRQLTMQTRPDSKLPEALSRIAPLTPLKLETHLRLLAAGVQAGRDMSEIDLVKTRLDQLDATCTSLLELAAVLGERFLESDLIDMFEQGATQRRSQGTYTPDGALDHALAQLHVEGVLLVIGHGERAFAHSTLHDAVYGRLSDERRRALHAVAARVSRLAKTSVTVRAVHLVRAKSKDAADVVLAAARRSERLFDDASVADFALAGLEILATRNGEDNQLPLRAELALIANRALRSPEDAEQAVELLSAQLQIGHPPATEAFLRAELGLALSRVERFDEAVVSLKKALGPALAAGDRAAMAHVYRNLGRVYAGKGDLERATAELREGLDMFTLGEGPRADVDVDLWKYLGELSKAYRDAGNVSEARQWCEHALFQAERRGDRLGMLRCHTTLAWILRDLRQLALAEQHVARALDEARYFGDRLTTAELLLERARGRAARGRLVEARRCCEEALRLAKSLRWDVGIQHAERAIAMLTRQGAHAEGAPHASESSHTLALPRTR